MHSGQVQWHGPTAFVQGAHQSFPWRTSHRRNSSVQDHFFEGLFGFVSISSSGEVVGVMHGTNDKFFLHSDDENGITILKFFVPLVIGVCIGEFEVVFYTLTSTEDDRACLPVYT